MSDLNFYIGVYFLINTKILNEEFNLWAISSVGLEHYLDRVGVASSNLVLPTKRNPTHLSGFYFKYNLCKATSYYLYIVSTSIYIFK